MLVQVIGFCVPTQFHIHKNSIRSEDIYNTVGKGTGQGWNITWPGAQLQLPRAGHAGVSCPPQQKSEFPEPFHWALTCNSVFMLWLQEITWKTEKKSYWSFMVLPSLSQHSVSHPWPLKQISCPQSFREILCRHSGSPPPPQPASPPRL